MSPKQVKFYFKSSLSVRVYMHIIIDNIMMCVFKSTVLNCKYFGEKSVLLFIKLIFWKNFT